MIELSELKKAEKPRIIQPSSLKLANGLFGRMAIFNCIFVSLTCISVDVLHELYMQITDPPTRPQVGIIDGYQGLAHLRD